MFNLSQLRSVSVRRALSTATDPAKTAKKKPIQPELEEYQRQVSELRKKYAQQVAHIPTAAKIAAQERQEKRQKADAEWRTYLERMRTALNDPQLPEGIDSMHKALRGKPVLAARRERIAAIKGEEGYREAAASRHHDAAAAKVEQRRKYLQLLKEESASWVTAANLEERVAAAIDNPVEFGGSHLAEVMERERAVMRRLQELKAAGPILPTDTDIINLQ